MMPPLQLKKSGLMLFLRESLSHPLTMGAAFPSSNRLASTIAQQIPLPNHHTIVELGAGTGALTAGMLANGIDPARLVIVERSSAMTQHLHKRFPKLQIINGDAREIATLLDSSQLPVRAIVSGLPLRSLSKAIVHVIGQQIDQVLEQDGVFIQFTYSLFSSPLSPSPNLKCIYSKYVWRNLPPARIDVFKFS